MNGFTYYAPTKVIFGAGVEEKVGALVREAGATKVLVHFGGQSALKSGLIDRICGSLRAEGIDFVTLSGAVPNPHLSKVREGIALGLAEKIDFLLPVGGGSVIDSAKAIAYGMAEADKDVWELFEGKRKAGGCLPVGCVLTIAAAGSEMSNSCVITNEETGEKRSYNDNLARPRFAVMNPELTVTLPDWQTESGCADIMMHTMERYFVNGETMELTDAIAEALLRTVMKNAEILHKNPNDLRARAEVMWASSLSHNGLTGCGNGGDDFAVHGMEHELGGMFDVTHGAGLAAIWGAWARYVVDSCLPRFVRYALNVMGVEPGETPKETALTGIKAMEAFYRRIGMPTNLRELGILPTEEQIEAMADSAAKACGGHKGSARVLFRDDMAEIYRRAL